MTVHQKTNTQSLRGVVVSESGSRLFARFPWEGPISLYGPSQGREGKQAKNSRRESSGNAASEMTESVAGIWTTPKREASFE